MNAIENTPEGAATAIREAAKARRDIPKFAFGWSATCLAYSIVVLREYESAWMVVRLSAALSAICLLIVVVVSVVRFTMLSQIGSLDEGEIFEGSIPDPTSKVYQEKLRRFAQIHRVAGEIGSPTLVVALLALFLTTASIIAFHLAA